MQTPGEFPLFDEHFSFLNRFILDLVNAYETREITSWDELGQRVGRFFTPETMKVMEAKAPGWTKMSSYAGGVTLRHVMCVFLGMLMLPEFQAVPIEQQQIAKWIILFHDIDKIHIQGKKDKMHAFRSAIIAANRLPALGFHVEPVYPDLIGPWSEYTLKAFMVSGNEGSPQPDNQKLPRILSEIDQFFGKNAPAALITKTVLLHISLDVGDHYPTPAPLAEDEIKRFIGPRLFPFMKIMLLADNEGWVMFSPDVKEKQKNNILQAVERIAGLLEKEE